MKSVCNNNTQKSSDELRSNSLYTLKDQLKALK